jgi:RNA polymerase sigma factor (sigma-70 family)
MSTHSWNTETPARAFCSPVAFTASTTDEELVAVAKSGDENAFETLVRRYRQRMFGLALRYTRTREDAEDVVQQAFHKAFVYLKNFEGKSSFSTWLTRIAINEALMWLRKVRSQREISFDGLGDSDGAASHFEVPDASPDPEATYLQEEEARILSAAMTRLTPRLRTVLELKELRELSTQETARHAGLSVAAVKARVFHGRRKLRRYITVLASRGISKRALLQSR